MTKSVSHPILTQDSKIRDDISRGLICDMLQFLTCIAVFIIYFELSKLVFIFMWRKPYKYQFQYQPATNISPLASALGLILEPLGPRADTGALDLAMYYHVTYGKYINKY